MKDQYVLEWSQQQNAFHIQPLKSLLDANAKCFATNTSHQYMTLMIGSSEACSRMADHWRPRLYDRSNTEGLAVKHG